MGLGWGIVGAGEIARDFAFGLSHAPGHRLAHVSARRPEATQAFAQRFGAANWGTELGALLADPAVEAVYIATPHPAHEAAARRAIAAGKPVLVEKPLAPSAAAVSRLLESARERGVLVMEGYMYRCHPLLGEIALRIQAGAIGPVRHIRAAFGFRAERKPGSRLFEPALAGGGIWDIGGYPLTFAQLVAGVALGQPFAHPSHAHFSGLVGPTGVDELAVAQLGFAGGISAQISCAIRHELGTAATIFGEGGQLEVPNPWLPSGDRQGTKTSFGLSTGGRTTHHEIEASPVFALEALAFEQALRGVPTEHAVSNEESQATAELLEAWHREVLHSSPHPRP